MDFTNQGIFEGILGFYLKVAHNGVMSCIPYAEYLVAIFGIIDLATSWWLYDGEMKFNILIQKALKISFFYFLVINWYYLMKLISSSFGIIGYIAGGHDMTTAKQLINGATGVDKFLNPSTLIDMGDSQCQAVTNLIFHGSLSIGGIFLALICWILIKLGFLFIALQVVLTNIEFAVFTVIAVILMPFGCLKYTNFLSQRSISGVFSFGIKLMVVYFLVGLIGSLADSLQSATAVVKDAKDFSTSISQIAKVAMAYFSVGYLTWKLPNMVQSMLNGTPSLGNDITPKTAASYALGAASAPYKGASKVAKGYSSMRAFWQQTSQKALEGATLGGAVTALQKENASNDYSNFSKRTDDEKKEAKQQEIALEASPNSNVLPGLSHSGESAPHGESSSASSGTENAQTSGASVPVYTSASQSASQSGASSKKGGEKHNPNVPDNYAAAGAYAAAFTQRHSTLRHFGRFSRRLAAAALSDTHFIQSYMEGARNANIAKADIDRVEHTWTHSDYTGTKGVGNKYRANRHFDESSHNDLF